LKSYTIKDKNFKILIESDIIQEAVQKIADSIRTDYADRIPTFLVVLKGALFFAADLIRAYKNPCRLELISAKSYGTEMSSSGMVKIKSLEENFQGKDIIIVEDIIDSGLTIRTLIDKLQAFNPASIEAAAIISKPNARKVDIEIKYVGIEIPDLFVIGYGLDYAEQGRELRDIYILDEN
jgi:hypoxanthine phosphoribosyltransferase